MIERVLANRRTFLGVLGAGLGTSALHQAFPWAAGLASAATTVPVGATAFEALPRPVRVIDTRVGLGRYGIRLASGDLRVSVTGVSGIPANARAIVATLTGVANQGPGYVTLWPSGSARPEVSNLNLDAVGEAVANLATVRLGVGGALDVFTDRPADVIIDIAGWYQQVDRPVSAGRSVLLDTPVRALDTRTRGFVVPAGGSVDVVLPRSIPGDATAVLVNLTAVGVAGAGYVSTGQIGENTPPETSNLNLNRAGETRAVASTVAVSTSAAGRGFRLWTTTAAHLLVDVMGSVTGASAPEATTGLFVPVAPRRLLDTRASGQVGRAWGSWLVECAVPELAGVSVGGAVINVTAVNARGPGYVSVLAARQEQRRYESVSHLNVDRRGQTASNHAVSRVAHGAGLSVYTSLGAHVLVDLAGYLVGTPIAARTGGYETRLPSFDHRGFSRYQHCVCDHGYWTATPTKSPMPGIHGIGPVPATWGNGPMWCYSPTAPRPEGLCEIFTARPTAKPSCFAPAMVVCSPTGLPPERSPTTRLSESWRPPGDSMRPRCHLWRAADPMEPPPVLTTV